MQLSLFVPGGNNWTPQIAGIWVISFRTSTAFVLDSKKSTMLVSRRRKNLRCAYRTSTEIFKTGACVLKTQKLNVRVTIKLACLRAGSSMPCCCPTSFLCKLSVIITNKILNYKCMDLKTWNVQTKYDYGQESLDLNDKHALFYQ